MSLLMYAKLIWLCTRVGVLSNSVSNGEIIFSPLHTFSNYSLANFTSATLKGVWSLDPYVNVARGFILGLVDYKRIQDLLVDSFVPPAPPLDEKAFAVVLLNIWAPLLVFVAIGFLLMLVIPIFCCCICCCRCCCKRCGARVTLAEADGQRRLYGLIILGVFLFGVLLLLARLPSVPSVMNETVEDIFSDLDNYLADIQWEIVQLAYDDLIFVTRTMSAYVNSLVSQVLKPFMVLIQPKLDLVTADISSIEAAISALDRELTTLSSVSVDIASKSQTLRNNLTALGDQLTVTKQQCTANVTPVSLCSALPTSTIVPVLPNFNTSIPTFQAQQDLLHDAQQLNLVNILDTAVAQFNNLPPMANAKTLSIRQNVMNELAQIPAMINSSFLALLDNALLDAADMIDSYRNKTRGISVTVQQYANNAASVMIVAGLILTGLAMLCIVGVVMGVTALFKPPTDRTTVNDCGANIVALSFYLAMIIVAVCFLMGDTLLLFSAVAVPACHILETRSFTVVIDNETRWNGSYLGRLVLHDSNVPLKLSDVISECEANKATWYVLMMDHTYNVSSMLDIKAFVPDMSSIGDSVNSTVQGLDIVSASSMTDFANVIRSNASSLDANGLTSNLYSLLNSINLQPLTDSLNNASSLMNTNGYPAYGSQYNSMRISTQQLSNVTLPAIRTDVDILRSTIGQLAATVSTLQVALVSTVNDINNFNLYLKTQAVSSLIGDTDAAVDEVIGYAQQYVDFAVSELHTDLARCGIIYNILDALIAALCDFTMGCVNALWLSFILAACGMVLFSCLGIHLTKYFRITEEIDDQNARKRL